MNDDLWEGGGERYRLARKKGIKDRAVGIPQEQKEYTDRWAAKAEHLVAQKCGVDFDKQLGTPNPHEFTLPDGRSVDVKWTRHENGSLIRWIHAKGDADIYVSVTGESLTIRGWAPKERLLSSVRDLGYGPTYVLHQDELNPGLSFLDGDPGENPIVGHEESRPLHTPGRCYFEAPAWSKYYSPHVAARRADGSEYCGTCHPGLTGEKRQA